MNKKVLIFIVVILVALSGLLLKVLYLQPQPEKYSGPVESLRVGSILEYSMLVEIAKKEGYFEKNGLDVTTVEYSSGAPAFRGLLSDEVDIATAAEFVGVRNSFEPKEFRILGSAIDSPTVFSLIALRDHGITKPTDLKGKKIGLTQKTAGEFYLGSFLIENGLRVEDIVQVNAEPDELKEAIVSGSVDAIITFEPHIDQVSKKLSKNSFEIFKVQGGYDNEVLLYTSSKLVQQHPDAVERFMKSLNEAELFIKSNPAQFKAFVKEKFHYSDEYTEKITTEYEYAVSLKQSLVVKMEAQARWLINNGLVVRAEIPNYLDFIYFDALNEVRPDAISIIR
jgi:ABC-type nitrate/sulfonate/bicarbonate transport system substrate-binding protein